MTVHLARITGVLLLLMAFAGRAHSSEVHSFTNLNRAIPDGNGAGLSDVRSVASAIAKLGQVRLKLRIVGEFNGDLYGYLRHTHPSGTNFCVLLNRPGRAATNSLGYADSGLDVTIADGASNGDIHLYRQVAAPMPGTPLSGIWQPDGRKTDPAVVTDASPRTTTLGSFQGVTGSGEWTLYLADIESGGSNMLAGWELELNGATAPPVIWSAPSDIVYGTALGAVQLNASSPVTGSFSYSPPAGTLLNAGGSQTLSVTFTPQDTVGYTVVTTNVPINVLKKSLTITAGSTNKVFGAPLPEFAVNYVGFANGEGPGVLDTPVTVGTTATAASDVGSYAITPGGAADLNYSITFVSGLLQVTPATTSGGLVSSANPAVPGSSVTFTCSLAPVAPGAGMPDGVVRFKVDGVEVGSPVSLSGGVATLNISTLPPGLHSVRAEYAGSLNFRGITNDLSPDQLINTPPVTGADTIERWPTNGTKVSIATLLANDSDTDGDSITLASFTTNSVHGGSLIESNGWLIYRAPEGFTNNDSFSYVIRDAWGAVSTGLVAIVVKEDTTPSPNLTITSGGDGSYHIRFNGVPGRAYRIEFAEQPVSPVWQPLGSATADDAGAFEFIDIPPQNAASRYYRSVYP